MINYIKKNRANFILLMVTLLLIFTGDRLLLFKFGLPLWEWDPVLHYKHRPNTSKFWNENKNIPIIINKYGHHDDSFPLKKRNKELRILNIGDSITMGHEVSKDETYSNYMELILSNELNGVYNIIQSINAGVQGYSTFQELEMLKRNLVFNPDVVTIGFCLNDVTEPFAVDKRLGGTGLDYHNVTQAPNRFLSYLLNETGYGRLIQRLRIKYLDATEEKYLEIYDVKKMLNNPMDKVYIYQWGIILKELQNIFDLCRAKNIPVILIIFPFTFQFEDNSMLWAQKKLINLAKYNNVKYLDVFTLFCDKESIKQKDYKKYFIDVDHLTPEGHYIVAEQLSYKVKEILNL
ncbi:MAG TPA: SGNH/GDSL hydrolase family protein [Melioribacteraceae bacterium]|nr:SGNH/GDSL hydrolase family protein [Melioribacteraceae bacterium]